LRLEPNRDIRERWLVIMEEVVERIMWMSVSDFDLVGNIIHFYRSSFFAFICL
jgi:hypothetical protein